MPEPTPVRRTDLTHSTRAAAGGDDHAWTDLVTRLDGILHAVAKRYRLGAADVDDVVQTTWLRAITSTASTIPEPWPGGLSRPRAEKRWTPCSVRCGRS